MEHVNKVSYLTGTYVKLAFSKYYIKDVNSRLKLEDGMIDIKKEFTHENGERSKVLVIYAISEQANKINEELSKIFNARHQHVSHQKTTSDERSASTS